MFLCSNCSSIVCVCLCVAQIVVFPKPFLIQGAVENWLNDLNRVQQNTMALVLEQAIEVCGHSLSRVGFLSIACACACVLNFRRLCCVCVWLLAAALPCYFLIHQTAVNWEHEKPRHVWLRDYPAQLVLTACLVYWTEETQAALDELEGGQEDSVKKYLAVRACLCACVRACVYPCLLANYARLCGRVVRARV